MKMHMDRNKSTSSFSLHPSALASIARPSLEALRRLWLPFVIAQACGAIVVVSYFNAEPMRRFCQRLADAKAAGGLLAAAVTMGLVSGVMPEVLKLLTRVDAKPMGQRLRDMVFAVWVFGATGITTDLMYQQLARIFGEGASVGVIAPKLLIDLGLYAPLMVMPWIGLMYTWREHRFAIRPTVQSLGVPWYVSRVATILILCWAYWLPMASLMYMLPASLTFVFSAVANVAVATILVAVAGRKTEGLSPSPSNSGEGSVESASGADVAKEPSPYPLPEYRERETKSAPSTVLVDQPS
jgi:hypothetical protein